MLLIPLVENAFKHGAIQNDVLRVSIVCNLENNKLVFEVSNTARPAQASKNIGIGLPNLKKRLGLLYGDKFSLNTHFANNQYHALLTINDLYKFANEDL
jgi:LytS/YehU family sensor histidine kinase